LSKIIFSIVLLIVPSLFTFHWQRDGDIKPTKVVEVPGYCEGIVFDRNGLAYISDTDNGKVYRVTPDGKASIWAIIGAPNGHKILGDGTHLICDGKTHSVLHVDANGKTIGVGSSESDGKPLRAPNDLTLDPKGGFYFTDPGESNLQNPIGTIHYVDPAGKTHTVAQGLAFPNGIVLRPDGKTLLVGESNYNHILSFEVLSPGKLGPKKVFAKLPAKEGDQVGDEPDGMCLDEKGNLYVAHYGMHQVQVVSPEGQIIHRHEAGNLLTSNVAFAGPNMDQLYITGALTREKTSHGALFRLDLKNVKGLRILPGQ
jgi:gluconolactonase